MLQKLKNEVNQTLLLLKNVPSLMVSLFVVSVIGMNVLAQQAIVNTNWLALDGGIFLSWLSFLSMDVIVKRYGPKASIRISVFAITVNFIFFAIQNIVTAIGIATGQIEYSLCSLVLPWWILGASTLAFIFSAIVNSYINQGVGNLFKKNPNGKVAYVSRTYISTFIGQFLDNLLFAFTCGFWASRVVEPGAGWGWWGNEPMTILGMVMMALTGAVVELLCEIVFSPFGYKTSKKWEEENIGVDYIDAEAELIDIKKQLKTKKISKKEYQEKFNTIMNYKYAKGERI